jgi:lipoprotein-releasing system ATP-binding protein
MSVKRTILSAMEIYKTFDWKSKDYVLKGIDVELKEGQMCSLMGKSGSGKSTLLYILSTLDTSYKGNLIINNTLLTGKKQDELARFRNVNIGFIFQFHYLLADFTCLDNVMLPALKLKEESFEVIENRACQLMQLLGLQDLELKRANKLSGGQQQRVAIARALINQPKIIMADEPTGNLDSKNAQLVFDVFRRICYERNQSIVIVTHDKDLALKSDRVIEISDGVIIFDRDATSFNNLDSRH